MDNQRPVFSVTIANGAATYGAVRLELTRRLICPPTQLLTAFSDSRHSILTQARATSRVTVQGSFFRLS